MPLYNPLVASHPGYVAGQYYGGSEAPAAGTLTTENRLYFTPIFIASPASFDRIGYTISVAAGDAQYQTRLGLYRNSAGRPGALIVDAGLDSAGTNTGARTVTISQSIYGWVWACIIGNRNGGATGTQATIRGYQTDSAFGIVFGHATPDTNNLVVALYHDQTVSSWGTYTLPATAPTLTQAGTLGVGLFIRAA